MKLRSCLAAAAVALATLGAASAANAAYVFVGSWEVDQGPVWTDGPLAYTGQEAAALLFGGASTDYAISTADNLVADINFKNWVSVIYIGTDQVAQDFKVSTGGHYQTPGDTSAYVWDNAQGADFTNYAFREVAGVPEPATWALMIGGFGLAGAALRRRRAITA